MYKVLIEQNNFIPGTTKISRSIVIKIAPKGSYEKLTGADNQTSSRSGPQMKASNPLTPLKTKRSY